MAGCGGGSNGDPARPAPSAASFPPVEGRTLGQIEGNLPQARLVVSPAGRVYEAGSNRLAFGVFTLGHEQVNDADIAIYAAHGLRGKAKGPFPARVDSLRTPSAFRAKTTADDPTAATSVYVARNVRLERKGEVTMLAVIRDGRKLQATRLPSVVVGQFSGVPDVDEPAPRVHTPTTDDVADISEIDTRIPPDSMHGVDYADVLGKEPILLAFATPQFCESRVCGPTVDIVEQVKTEVGDGATFIHSEIYNENDPSKGLLPQVKAFNLPSEPWAFVIDRNGKITARFEGAFGAEELRAAVTKVTG